METIGRFKSAADSLSQGWSELWPRPLQDLASWVGLGRLVVQDCHCLLEGFRAFLSGFFYTWTPKVCKIIAFL